MLATAPPSSSGRFLGALLETVSRWHLEDSVYSLECAKTPGFISMMRSSGQGNEKQDLDYENFRHITFKWHFKLTKSFAILLESKDYLQVRLAGSHALYTHIAMWRALLLNPQEQNNV